MDPASEPVIRALKDVLRRWGEVIDPSESGIHQLGKLMHAINKEFRRVARSGSITEILFLRAEFNVSDSFDIFLVDRDEECQIRIPRASLYDEE